MKISNFLNKPAHISILRPSIFVALLLMILNDHFLKHSDLLPKILSGKISDFTFLYFAPVLASWFFRVKKVKGLFFAYFIISFIFVLLNTSVEFSLFVQRLFFLVGFPSIFWPDITDLIALMVVPFSLKTCLIKKDSIFNKSKNWPKYLLAGVSILACLHTSPQRPYSTHTPIYMDWVDFRGSVKILEPQSIETRGKIYIKDNYLFINEPNKGIHIYDTTDKQNPIAISFIELYGNVDLAVKDKTLYADSFTDLLIFDLSDPKNPVFVRRINDQFQYDPVQTAPPEAIIFPDEYKDPSQGVIIRWEKK